MGGLIKWLKKDGTQRMRRRESAPLQLFNKRRPTSEETYRESLIRFTKFRENERIKRLSMGANEMNAYHSVCDDMPNHMNESTTPTDQRLIQHRPKTCPPKPYRSQNNANGRMDIASQHNGYHRTKKVSVQFHLSESTEESEMIYDSHRSARHSMPATTTNGYMHGVRRGQNSLDSQTIQEEDIEKFEDAHCKYSNSVNDDDQSSYRSPPSKFYKQNLNPFPSTSEASSLSTFGEMQSTRMKCPEKPKRLLLNSKQSRKLLTEAHFTGAYRNFEIQSPYYSDSSSVFSSMAKRNYASTDADSLTDDQSQPPNHYQVIVNKHGDEVEYALPCIDMAEYQKRKTLPNCFTSDDSILAGEIFNENPHDFDRILSENFEMGSNVSISMNDEMPTHHQHHRDQHHNGRHIMITDLDKSNDSIATLNDLKTNSTSELEQINRIDYYHQVLSQQTAIICSISDIDSAEKIEAKLSTPLHFEWGVFKTTNITVRKYCTPMDSSINDDYQLIVETAIIRDAEFLRKIRHQNVVNLMAIAFEPYQRLALIMEPTKYSLNYYVFVKNKQLSLSEVVTVMRKMADAVQYMHECNVCHSNISSHAILVGDDITQVKLSSFELAISFKSDIQDDSELKSVHKSKYMPFISRKHSPKSSLSFDQKINRYKLLSKDQNASEKSSLQTTYCVPFIRELNTKYLQYCIEYRRKLSIFNYQAPELLSETDPFVFPTKHSDTYALALLLWELLNQCVPFVIYDEAKLCELLKTNYPLKFLPIVEEERCQRFHDILERGLKREPDTRIPLDKLIRKLSSIEAETMHEHEKTQNPVKCCCLKTQNGKIPHRPQEVLSDDVMEKMTPDKSSKLYSMISSPKPSPLTALSANTTEKNISPMNNVTFHRSMLDFNKLLSPRRDTNDDTYQRSSTLKRRKKIGPTDGSKRNVRDLFGMDNAQGDKQKACVVVSSPDSNSNSSGHPSNEFNNALTKSAIYKELDYTNNEDQSVTETNENAPIKKIEQPFGPKEEIDHVETNGLKSTNTNSSYQFVIDEYELPQELIARNNKIRRCTWLSTDQVNASMQYEPLYVVASSVQPKINDVSTIPSLDESNDSSKPLNVSIKIVHTQLTPNKNANENESFMSRTHRSLNESMKSDCSSVSGTSSEENFSVKSRIKFFRSLESQPVHRRTPNKNKMSMSRRSEMSFNEAKKAIEKSQRYTYPSSNQPKGNQQLLKDIVDLTADIKNCLSKNKHLNEKKGDDTHTKNEKAINFLLTTDLNEADESVVMLRNIFNENSKNETDNEDGGVKRNSVRETVQKFEQSLGNDKNNKSFPLRKIENKLLNEKILNTDFKFDSNKGKVIFTPTNENKHDKHVTDEKVEDVIRIEAPPEAENEAGARPIIADMNEQTSENVSQHSQQTLIKRTFYQESIISGTNMEMPELKTLLVNAPNMSSGYATTRKSSLTTRVTLNMRKCRRRASDVGLIGQNRPTNALTNETAHSPCMPDVRHSICGSPLPFSDENKCQEPSSGGALERISDEQYPNRTSGLMVSNEQLRSSVSSVLAGNFNGKPIQSIEDLYIDDDFGGLSLAANMKLMTNSVDSLDNINFDIISTHIFEQTSESMMATNADNLNATKNKGNGNAIEYN